jgi:hypothetical protein
MRKFLAIAVIALTAAFGGASADAQVRIKVFAYPGIGAVKQRGPKIPRVNPVKPKIVVLPPSAALRRALAIMPNAKPLGVTLRGQTYIVRLKTRGTVAKIGVNAVTGAASPL